MEINKIYNEPCLETLKKMPNNFLDCVITSPPYWQLRDYGYNGQWGLEPTYQEYLQNLWLMMDEIYRVLKPSGTVWINLGDTYNGFKLGNTSNKGYKENTKIDTFKKQKINEIKNKCLLLIPHRFAIGCIDRGWIVRNDIIWAKRNGMPESCTDRFSKKHEYFFFMVKSEKYHFDLDSIRDKNKTFENRPHGIVRNRIYEYDSKMNNLELNKKQYSIIDDKFRNPVIETRDLPNHDILREYLNNNKKLSGLSIKVIETIFNSQAPHHWFEKNGSYPSKQDWIKLKELLNLDDTFDNQMTDIKLKNGLKENNPKGKNPGDVSDFWDINTKPNKEKHYAQYNDELIKKPILSGCPIGGLIYDPFMGTGSTADACIRSKRNFIGSEMSKDYLDIANNRILNLQKQKTLF
jgi:site-specific DNA-methyltransferase (adenine-specific)